MCVIMLSSTERAPASASCAITLNHGRRYHQGAILVDDAIFLRQLLLHYGHANINDRVLYIRLSFKESVVRFGQSLVALCCYGNTDTIYSEIN